MNKKHQFNKEQEEAFQLKAVRQNGYNIHSIKNPSEQVQLEAVRQNGNAINYIKNPSEQVQLEAVKQDGRAIQYIKNPSEQVQLEAVRQNGCSRKYIDNPSSYIKSVLDVIKTSNRVVYVLHEEGKEPLFSVGCQCNINKEYFKWRIYNMDNGLEKNPYRLEYIDVINKYINKDERIDINEKYQFTKEQEEKFQLKAVRQDGNAIKYIKNPSEQLQLEAVKENGCAIYYIKNPSLEVQLEAVRQDGCAICFIYNPSEQVQLEALRQNGSVIKYIKNPSDYIKSIVDVIEMPNQPIFVLHEPNKEPLFTTECQCNITKDYLIWRIYNLNCELEKKPYRREYLNALNRY